MLKKSSMLVHRESGAEWRLDARTVGQTIPAKEVHQKPQILWVFVLSNLEGEKRFVYEHLYEKEYLVKAAD